MRHVVVGTAGHIDHGKTALVKALTGIDTDRLKEEKERGITIDLGFAHLELEPGLTVGIVDVPGHERFIKNMLAGVGGIDLVMLIVAADEGVMPQTREHLAICQLLRVRDGLVALTKTDLVEADWLELVQEDVATFLRGSFLEGRPIVPVSAKTGEGVETLRAHLTELARAAPPKATDATFRLPIDRVFTIRGFGTVVTGTVTAGRIGLEERVEVYPKGVEARVRGLQTHGRPVTEAIAGQRTAVNLQGVERAALERGDVLSVPGLLRPTYMVDASLELLREAPRPLRHRERVRFHIGTSEVMARVVLLQGEALEPGERGYVQLRLEAPVVALPRDRYVVRSYSPMVTIGGGELLDIAPLKARRSATVAGRLRILEHGSPEEILEEQLRRVGPRGSRVGDLAARTCFGAERLRALLARLVEGGRALAVDRESYLHAEVAAGLRRKALEVLGTFHAQHPLKPGMSKEELRMRLGEVEERSFLHLLGRLEAEGAVAGEKDKVRLASHQVRLDPRQQAVIERLEAEFRTAGVSPPSPEEAFAKVGPGRPEDHELLQVLLDERRLIRIKEGLLFHVESLQAAEARLVAHLRARKEITPGEFKDLLGITRKYAIPLMEYFDAQRLTVRVGDKRVLRADPAART
ncbi:MAG: selenocysteine-specific translation elongation factor [Candidatus Rokubacteria bacterium]|nr:selenocysteine-specific translation elongation factor [Candidatus Rokubacteria bacterium]